jgi:hypothetical protein
MNTFKGCAFEPLLQAAKIGAMNTRAGLSKEEPLNLYCKGCANGLISKN